MTTLHEDSTEIHLLYAPLSLTGKLLQLISYCVYIGAKHVFRNVSAYVNHPDPIRPN
jgi:hypothetical protein